MAVVSGGPDGIGCTGFLDPIMRAEGGPEVAQAFQRIEWTVSARGGGQGDVVGAIVPEAVGVNPSRTIAALAERASALIVQDGRF